MSLWSIILIILGIVYAIGIIITAVYEFKHAIQLDPNEPFYNDEVGPKDFKTKQHV